MDYLAESTGLFLASLVLLVALLHAAIPKREISRRVPYAKIIARIDIQPKQEISRYPADSDQKNQVVTERCSRDWT